MYFLVVSTEMNQSIIYRILVHCVDYVGRQMIIAYLITIPEYYLFYNSSFDIHLCTHIFCKLIQPTHGYKHIF